MKTLRIFVLSLTISGAAAACPMCAADTREEGVETRSWLLGAMMLVPFVVVGAAAIKLRKVLQ